MTAVIVLLALSALIGFAVGTSFSWLAIAASSTGIAVLSSAILQIQGFGADAGIVIVVACLTVSQIAYLASVFSRIQVRMSGGRPSARRFDRDVHRGPGLPKRSGWQHLAKIESRSASTAPRPAVILHINKTLTSKMVPDLASSDGRAATLRGNDRGRAGRLDRGREQWHNGFALS
jgi:hypothetical protein